MKKILFIVNYYYPYISGVSEYVRLIAEELVKQNYDVTVLASNHDKLDKMEILSGVKIIRTNIICKISKGTVSPEFIIKARELSKVADVVNLHLPMIESGIISSIIDKAKLVVTYHCDINLKENLINNIIVKAMDVSNSVCCNNSSQIIATSIDYAKSSRILNKYIGKTIEIPAPLKELKRDKMKVTIDSEIIGFCGRIVEEKGIFVLLKAFYKVKKKLPCAKLIIGGDYENIAGGSIYPELMEFIKHNQISDVEFIGRVKESKMSEFYSNLDVLVLPSINSLEAFGMVQIEAMMCGTPVVASNLPGVRTIVQNTGMGLIAKVKNEDSLAECILEILSNKNKYIKDENLVKSLYGTKKTIEEYIKCFENVVGGLNESNNRTY